MTRQSKNDMAAIAAFAAQNPAMSAPQIAAHFQIPVHQARYAIKKFAHEANISLRSAEGRSAAARLLEPSTDEPDAIRKQIRLTLAELDANPKMSPASRAEILFQITRIRQHLQSTELQAHLKRADAQIIKAIIKRFKPDVTDDDVIAIYSEDIEKLRL